MQRTMVTKVTLQSLKGKSKEMNIVVNDWVEVQEGNYRYLAIDDLGGVVIKIVISEFLACIVHWVED